MTTRPDTEAFTAWLAALSYNGIRALESAQPALPALFEGRRLRGIELVSGLYLGRDRQCYGRLGDEGVVVRLTPSEVLAIWTFEELRVAFQQLCRARVAERARSGTNKKSAIPARSRLP